ncbi:MAG: maleylpyruvate isomerase N-terminal domain-containing protein [Chloroflexi bacterium]|nr:maleylpyruvate isomerase N-terminal domain-containing protein [Chloroflexota bacterium]
MAAERIAADLARERERLYAGVARIAPSSLTTPGLVGEWSAREMIAHLGYWAGHAAELIHAVQEGRGDEVGQGEPPVDEVNATVARVARQTDIGAVRKREAASIEALVERLRELDDAILAERLPGGATLEEAIREDGPNHYREHAEELESITGGRADG